MRQIAPTRPSGQTDPVELLADLDAPCPPDHLFGWIDDLDRYERWLSLVRRTERDESGSTEAPAWTVDLEAQLGPLARAKRLRMERTHCEPPHLVVFERRELDGRDPDVASLEGGAWAIG